jgi:WhiB family redox-sensing transcriptional regulator
MTATGHTLVPTPSPTGTTLSEITQEVTPMNDLDLFTLLEVIERTDLVPCRVHDAEIWFAQTPEDVEFAKALCATCPAVELCLAHALEAEVSWGIWGGELFERGVLVARKRPRGRPRNETVAA